MSKHVFVGEEIPKAAQWATDASPCTVYHVPSCREVLIEVTGDLSNSAGVTIEGGLVNADKMNFLAFTKTSPYLVTVPAVSFVRPITDAIGVTITVKAIK